MDSAIVGDWEMSKKRFEAWWHNEMIDRPVVSLACQREKPRWPLHKKAMESPANRKDIYLDAQHRVECTENQVASHDYFGDSAPSASRGINTAYLGSFAGANPGFSDVGGAWIDPCVEDWSAMPKPTFDPESRMFKEILAVSDALAENSRGRYLLALPDHLDAVTTMSQMRGVEQMCLDLIDDPESVYSFRDALVQVWLKSYDFWWKRDHEYGFDVTANWAGAVSTHRANVLQCDFSYMISPDMFKDLVKPELETESQHLDASLYHWDGKGQVCHFEHLRSISKLTAIQWVPGAGVPTAAQWPDPPLKAQKAGYPIQIFCEVAELERIFELFDPMGLFLVIHNGQNSVGPDVCRSIMKRIELWAAGRR